MNFESNLYTGITDDDLELTSETDRGGVVIPRQTCAHVRDVSLCKDVDPSTPSQCIDCDNADENWLCLSCGEVHCSRYVNNHGEEHWLFTLLTDGENNIGHCLTINLGDFSVWCYLCDSYIINVRLSPLLERLVVMKFGAPVPDDSSSEQQIADRVGDADESISATPSTIIAVQDPSLLDQLNATNLLTYCFTVPLRPASVDELVRLHSNDYVTKIVSAEKSHASVQENHHHPPSPEDKFSAARVSAGTTIDVMENILTNHRSGLIIVTSSGHGAGRDSGDATSIYNNVALAVDSVLVDKKKRDDRKSSLALIDSNLHVHREGATPIEDAICHMIHVLSPSASGQRPLFSVEVPAVDSDPNKIRLERVLIVDLTSEHGHGLQSIYYESEQVIYVSIHGENAHERSSYDQCGQKQGLGFTMNIPLASLDTMTDKDYVDLMNELVLPLGKEFQPELIVVCVDFHLQQLTEKCYAWIVEQLTALGDGKLVVISDGNLSCLPSKSSYVQTVLSVLLGKLSVLDEPEWSEQRAMHSDVRQKIDLVKEIHRKYWSSLR